MNQIKLYTRAICGWCQEAKACLHEHNIPFEEIDVSDPAVYAEMQQLSGQRFVPTIVVDGQILADFDVPQLEAFLIRLHVLPKP